MSYLERVTECDKCGHEHIGRKRHDPGDGCWANPGGSRERITVDYEAAIAFMDQVGIRSLEVAMDPDNFIRRVVDAALGVDTE